MYLGLSITDQSETADFSYLLFTSIHAVPRVMARCLSLMAAINSQQTRARKCSGVAEVAWSAPLVPRPRHRPLDLVLGSGCVEAGTCRTAGQWHDALAVGR